MTSMLSLRIKIQDVERIIGCTGSPADSHDVLWFDVKKDKQSRCTECGSGELNISVQCIPS